MSALYRDRRMGETLWRKRMAALLIPILIFAALLSSPAMAEAAGATCKSLCQTALKATGNSKKLKYKSEAAQDFAGFSFSQQKKVSSIMYVFDAKEVYCLCVVKAASPAAASSLQKNLKSYQSNNCNSNYLGDYSSTEQKVLKNAVYGRRGEYVWYIAMSPNKSVNKKGQAKIIKALKA